MAFGISFIDIDLLIRLARNQNAENQPLVSAPEAAILADAPLVSAPALSLSSDSFSTKSSETNIAATLTETLAPVLPIALTTEKPAGKNEKTAENVFNSTPTVTPSGIRNAPVNVVSPTSFTGAQKPKQDLQNEMDAELIFRNLLERFRASVTYDYEISDALKLEEDAERKQKPLGNANENRIEAERRKSIQDKENFKQEALRKSKIDEENNSADDKRRELWKKIEEANKFL